MTYSDKFINFQNTNFWHEIILATHKSNLNTNCSCFLIEKFSLIFAKFKYNISFSFCIESTKT